MSLLDKVRKIGEGVKTSLSAPLVVKQVSYKVQAQLAEGGFGYVYLANDTQGRSWAIKKIIIQTPEALEGARQEIAIWKVLSGKPNIIELKDYEIRESSKPKEAYLVMPFCSGGSLVTLLNSRLEKRLAEKEIIEIFYEVAKGVLHCHAASPPIIHRDIKLENVLIERGRYYLCDFGSATRRDYFPTQKSRVAIETELERNTTLMYRAPEMCDLYMERWINEKSDIWALGCLLYKMMYLINPFEEGGKLKIINGNVTYPPKPTYSAELLALLRSMFTVDPNDRPDIDDVLCATATLLKTSHSRVIPKKEAKPPPSDHLEPIAAPSPPEFFELLENAGVRPQIQPPQRSTFPTDHAEGPTPVALSPPPQHGPSRLKRTSDSGTEPSVSNSHVSDLPSTSSSPADFFGPNLAASGASASVFNDDDFSKLVNFPAAPLNLEKTSPSLTTDSSNILDFFTTSRSSSSPTPSGDFFGTSPASPSNGAQVFQFFAPVGTNASVSAENAFGDSDDFSKVSF